MVEVMALGDKEGGNSPHPVRPPLERLLPQEQDMEALEWTCLVQVAEALERTRLVLLSKVVKDEDARRRMSTTLREFYDAHGVTPAGLAHGLRRDHGLSAVGPSRVQIQRSPSSSQGLEGHN
jgi:hypothetical protein